VLLSDVCESDDVTNLTNLIKEKNDDGTLICSAQDHESKSECVIDIGQLCHQDKVQGQSVSQMNFGKDATCRNPISPEAAPCLVGLMNELYGPPGVQAESDCDCINDVRVCQLPQSVMNRLTAKDVCCAEDKQFVDEETCLNVCECDKVDERYQCVATDRRRDVSDDADDDVGSHVLSDDSYRRVIVSDVSRVVADKAEIDQILVLSVCRDGCGDKLPSVGFEQVENVDEGRQMSLSRTDEADETTGNQDHGFADISCSVTPTDTAPSPARDRRQLDVVPKKIDESTNDVLDPGAQRQSSGIAICDDVYNSLLTSPSAVTCRYPDYSPVVDALSTSTTMRGLSNYPEAGDAFPAFSVRTCPTKASAFGRIDMTLSLFIYLCVMNVMSSIGIVSRTLLNTLRVDNDVVLWVMELLCSVLTMRAVSCDKPVSDRTMSAVMRCHDVWLFNIELVWDVLMRLLRCCKISGDRLMDRIHFVLISGLSMLILLHNVIIFAGVSRL